MAKTKKISQDDQSWDKTFEQIVSVSEGVIGIMRGMTNAVDNYGLTKRQIDTFIHNTPGHKKGVELMREFISRRDAMGAKKGYNFNDFIKEVIAKQLVKFN